MSGPLNLMKLCVGCDTPAALDQWQRHHWQGGPARHVTRMWPKRQDELLAGGSIYWVFKGIMQARQRLVGLEEVTGADGMSPGARRACAGAGSGPPGGKCPTPAHAPARPRR